MAYEKSKLPPCCTLPGAVIEDTTRSADGATVKLTDCQLLASLLSMTLFQPSSALIHSVCWPSDRPVVLKLLASLTDAPGAIGPTWFQPRLPASGVVCWSR